MRRLAWFCANFGKGSGGHRTVFQNMNYLAKHGYQCDLYIVGMVEESSDEIKKRIERDYCALDGNVYVGEELREKYDAAIATFFITVKIIDKLDVPNKLYFIQDYEPWFYPMGENYLEAQGSYGYGFRGISIGRWLERKISGDYGVQMKSFSFCADHNNYKRDEKTKKEDAVCFIFQPDKPRRCAEMGLKALQIVKKKRPETKVYLYGSEKMIPFNLEAEHLGLLSVEECNELYNKCKVGVCMSSSNPSRIPFEMMAAGLPVVDLYLDNNLYDLPEDGCLLAEPSAESVAEAILKILGDDALGSALSSGGARYMKNYPLLRGFREFKDDVDDHLVEKPFKKNNVGKIYRKKAVKYIGEGYDLPPVFFKTEDELRREKEEKEKAERERQRLEDEKQRLQKEKEWRENLTFWQRVYLKIRYLLIGR